MAGADTAAKRKATQARAAEPAAEPAACADEMGGAVHDRHAIGDTRDDRCVFTSGLS